MLKKEHVFLEIDLKTKDDILSFISSKALELKLVTNQQELLNGFYKREEESSTAFEDGFAIPHAKVKGIKQAHIICVKSKTGVDWNSMDGKPTQIAIALIIPENANTEHLDILSNIATKLMNDKLRSSLKKAKTQDEFIIAFENTKSKEVKKTSTNNNGINIVAITACVVGVAHTYMAEEKLLEALSKAGHNIRVETQGSKGVGTPLSKAEIDKADVVILATDTKVDTSRFVGKKVYQTHVARAIKEPIKVLNEAIEKGSLLGSDSTGKVTSEFSNSNGISKEKEGVIKHILAGISYMIPIIVLGGICLAFSLGIAKAIWGPEAGTKGPMTPSGEQIYDPVTGKLVDVMVPKYPWNPLAVMEIIGGASFALMIPILAAFIGNSIAGRAAIAPAMVGAFIGNNASYFMPLPGMGEVQTPMGFIGAIIAGLLVGYFVKWVNSWNVPRALQAAMPIFFIPLTAGIGISVIFIYVIGGPIGYVMGEFSKAISNAYTGTLGIGIGLGLGLLLGAMASFDMGGPINKIAFVTSAALITSPDGATAQPMGTMAAAIPVAPLGMGFTTILFARFFTRDEREMGKAAIIMGTIGISEGAIPFAIRDPKRAITANVLGGMVAGAFAGAFAIQDHAAHGGPIVAILGAVPYGWQTAVYFIAVGAGVATTTLVYGFWLVASLGKVGSVKENHINHIENLISERNEAISSIKFEIMRNKRTIKDSTDQKQIDTLTTKNQSLLEQIRSLKEEFKVNKQKANEVYKSIKDDEAKFVKENKQSLIDFNKAQKQIKANALKTVREEKINKVQNLDSLAKKEYLRNYSQNVLSIKDEYQNNLVKKQIDLRLKYVNKYNSKI